MSREFTSRTVPSSWVAAVVGEVEGELLTVGATALEVVRPRRLLRPAWTRYATDVV